jgi:hypothetical protein
MPGAALLWMLVLLAGCAANARLPAAPPASSPDCSFRSATSCWTLEARFPPHSAEPADSVRPEPLRPALLVQAKQQGP